MAQTPEGRVKDAIKKSCKLLGAYYYMPVSNGMGAPALDFIICYMGYFFSIEAKAPGKKPTARQELTIRAIKNAHGLAYVVDSVDAAKKLVELLPDVVAIMNNA